MNERTRIPLPRPEAACSAFVDLLPLLGEETLAGDEAQALREHLSTCAYCQTQRATYERIATALSRYGEPAEERPFSAEELLQITQDAPPLPAAPPTPAAFPAAPRRRVVRLVSGFSALAAVLVIAIITATLIASHHPASSTTAAHTPTPGQPGNSLSVYVSINDPHSNQNALVALNASDGSPRWRHNIGSMTLSTMILQNGALYASASDGSVYAFSTKDGSVLWSFKALLHTYVDEVVNGVVYAGSDNETQTNFPGDQYSYALDASTGHLLWTFTKGENIGPVVNTIVYVQSDPAQANRTLYALNVSDGSVRWTAQGHLLVLWTVADGLVYTTSTQIVGRNMDPYDTIHALDASTGKERWTFPHGEGATMQSAIADNGMLYFLSNEGRGDEPPDVVYALNASDGSVRWHVPLSPGAAPELLLNNGVLYLAASDTTMLALNADTGSKLWQASLNVAGAPVIAGDGLLAVSNTVILQRYPPVSSWNIAVLNASDGSVRWHYSMKDQGQMALPSTIVDGVLYVSVFTPPHPDVNAPVAESYLLAFNASDGTLEWSYDVGALSPFFALVG